jgi:hypothetical protein
MGLITTSIIDELLINVTAVDLIATSIHTQYQSNDKLSMQKKFVSHNKINSIVVLLISVS